MLAAIRHNCGLKLVSLVIGVIAWVHVQNRVNPVETDSLSLPVEVPEAAVPQGMVVARTTPETVTVEVRGRREQLDRIQPEAVHVVVNALGIRETTSGRLSPRVTGLPPGVAVAHVDPSLIEVVLDKQGKERHGTRFRTTGELPVGLELNTWSAVPAEVEISGPLTRLAKVQHVDGVFDVTDLTESTTAVVKWEAVDRGGQPVAGVEVDPAEGTVQLEVQSIATKTLPVRPNVSDPPGGYRIGEIKVRPSTVTVTGDQAAIDKMNHVPTARVDLSGATGPTRRAVSLDLPHGVRTLKSASVVVNVELQRISPPEPPPGEDDNTLPADDPSPDDPPPAEPEPEPEE